MEFDRNSLSGIKIFNKLLLVLKVSKLFKKVVDFKKGLVIRKKDIEVKEVVLKFVDFYRNEFIYVIFRIVYQFQQERKFNKKEIFLIILDFIKLIVSRVSIL